MYSSRLGALQSRLFFRVLRSNSAASWAIRVVDALAAAVRVPSMACQPHLRVNEACAVPGVAELVEQSLVQPQNPWRASFVRRLGPLEICTVLAHDFIPNCHARLGFFSCSQSKAPGQCPPSEYCIRPPALLSHDTVNRPHALHFPTGNRYKVLSRSWVYA